MDYKMIVKAGGSALILVFIGALTIIKMPKFLSYPLMLIPSWLQTLLVHFPYSSWLGGVTGHLVGGLASLPWYFVSKLYLRPKILGRS